MENVVFRIFNRWGEKVFESTSADIGWNGIFKEKNAPLDTYVWILEYNAVGESAIKIMKGMVNLIK
ncbi:MAG: gliding motility-associated C-terminal domain-containing protein [Bacteroidetes bacterium]|nr:gliding motility-associated C-terminal domain-containing protein [Bacteroidota bacterium]